MKITIALFTGLLAGLLVGWYYGHTPLHAKASVNRATSFSQTDVEDSAYQAQLLVAMNAISGEKPRGDKFFAEIIGTCYYNYAIKPTTNQNILFWRTEIEQLAKTNPVVAAELEADAKVIQNHE
jgi:hypothetical protein